MREIELTRGYVALVDDEDYDRVSQHLWYAEFKGNAVYARCRRGPGLMHCFIAGKIAGLEIDHADGNTLNNTRSNLRFRWSAVFLAKHFTASGPGLAPTECESDAKQATSVNQREARNSMKTLQVIEGAGEDRTPE